MSINQKMSQLAAILFQRTIYSFIFLVSILLEHILV